MSAIITIPGENLIALCQGQGRHLNIDKMIFANVPDIDPEAAIDRSEQKPASELIVHESIIPDEYKAYVNPNQVVYSTVLDSNTGNYEFNWIGLYCSEEDVVVAITTLPKISKWKTEGQVQGNHLTRNFMLEFTGASECTGMSVTADTWQLDFSARLNSIDERERLSSRDTYGRARFWKDGYKVMHTDSGFVLSAGVGYVEGIRIDLEENLPIPGDTLPKSVWLDVSYKLQGSNVIAIATPVYGDTFSDYTKDAINHYVVKLAEISEVGLITDFRTVDNIESDLVEYLKKQVTDHNLDLDAHSELLSKLATGIPEILSPTNESTEIGETPVFICSEFVPVFVNTTMTASQWQIDFNSEDFSSPIYDSGSTSSALTSLELPAGYLQVSTLYKARCRRRLNTGQWSPWSDIVSFTTRDVFNYVKRPVNVAPADGATSVPEKPILKSGPFSIVGDMTDTLEATQFRIRKGGNILHISPEIAGSMEYVLPAGLLVVFSDYTLECRQKGTELGWSDWSTPTSFRTATAFITGDEAVYPSSWVGHDNATVAGLALDDGAELRSNGTDQEEDEGDWVQYSVRAKIRHPLELEVKIGSTTESIVLKSDQTNLLTNNDKLFVNQGNSGINLTKVSATSIIESAGFKYSAKSAWIPQENIEVSETDLNVIYGTHSAYLADVLSGDFKIGWICPGIEMDRLTFGLFRAISKEDFNPEATVGVTNELMYETANKAVWIESISYSRDINGIPALFTCSAAAGKQIVLERSANVYTLSLDGVVYHTKIISLDDLHFFIGSNKYGTGLIQNIRHGESLDCTYTCSGFSPSLSVIPNRVLASIDLTSATSPTSTDFVADDFTEIPTDSVSIGTDTDPDNPNYVLLESSKQSPAESFRRIALGVKGLAKDSECRVTETQIDMWKKAATEGDNILSPTSWEIHDKASVEGLALEDNAVLGSNGIDQIIGGADWYEYTTTSKIRSPYELEVDSASNINTLVFTSSSSGLISGGNKLFLNEGNNGIELKSYIIGSVTKKVNATGGAIPYPFSDGKLLYGSTYANQPSNYSNPFKGYTGGWGTGGTGGYYSGSSNKYCGWLFNSSKTISAFSFQTQNDIHMFGPITFQASVDGTNWIDIQTWADTSRSYTSEGMYYLDKPITLKGFRLTEKDGGDCLCRLLTIYSPTICTYTCTNITPALTAVPDKAFKYFEITGASGANGTQFAQSDFKPLKIESATFGADSDPVHPNYLTLKSTTQTPAETFRRVALGLNGLAKDSECRVAETQIEVKKKVSIPDIDGAVAPTSWEIHENASAEGVALEDGAVLGSNGVDQGTNETDWTEYSVTAKVRDNGINILDGTTAALLKTSSKVMEGEKLITEIGTATMGEVTVDTNTIATNDPNPFGDGSGIALYPFNGDGKNLVGGNDFTSGLTFTNDSKFGQAVNATTTNTINIPVSMKNCTLSWWSKMGIAQSEFSWIRLGWHTSGICGPSPSTGGFLFYSSDMGIKSGLNYTPYNDGKYHHICVVFSASGNKAYIDGSVFATYNSSSPDQSYIKGLGYGDSGKSMNYDQFRIFNRALTLQEVQELYKEKIRIYSADISSGDFPSAPTKAHKMPALTSATGAAGTAFTANSFTELPIETATIGKDSDAEHPDYILLKSEKQIPKESFRRVALGVKDLAKDSECRVAETQIDTWKQGA